MEARSDAKARGGGPIRADDKVRDVLMRHPDAGPIFLQHGRLFSVERGELYLRYPELTIAQYAERGGIGIEALLKLLNAVAEDRGRATPKRPRRGIPTIGTIGYTGTYREPDPNLDLAPVVEVQEARGPV
jgi:hypothetical protein